MKNLTPKVIAHVKKIYTDEYKKEKRKWVRDLHDSVKKRYDKALKTLSKKMIEIDTEDDVLFISLYYKAYSRVLSYSLENNIIFPIYPDEFNIKVKAEHYTNAKKDIERILDDIFSWVEIINGNASYGEPLKTIIEQAQRKYPKKLFIRANEIYMSYERKPGERFMTYDLALEKSLSEFDDFNHIGITSLEFDPIRDSYKKFRSPNKVKDKKHTR